MEQRIFGYVVHKLPHHILPSTPMFSNEKGTVTAEMIKDTLDYIIKVIAMKDPMVETYKKARMVFTALRMRLENKTPQGITKEAAKIAIDVLKEILNEHAASDKEKLFNEEKALWCKLMIERHGV